MTDHAHDREAVLHKRTSAGRRRMRLVLIAIFLLLAIVFVPPYISVGRYKSRITQVISASLGRPVRLSSVELRLFPWPSFLLTDLSVGEDPAYGAEPVLHADTVRANLRLLSLWQGKLEISSIHVDSASLNLVRATPGHWNLDPLFRTAASQPGSALRAANLPYLEATNSRINIKNGAEKLPFSLVNTDLSFWQASPGDWRLTLRGQPARTDVALEMGDTGTVRLEASLRRAPELHEMPLHLDLNWQSAQLGALARLVAGSDPGWRGDLTGEAHLDGTPDAARVTTRLRATGVHRAEFAPPSPLDFDANCGFTYHYSQRALEKLVCNSPLGNGQVRITGNVPGNGEPDLTVELNRIPAGAGLDLLRTMRSDIASSLEAAGTVSGKLVYSGTAAALSASAQPRKNAAAKEGGAQRALSGNLTIDGFSLSGGPLSEPLSAPRIVLAPLAKTAPGAPEEIAASTDFPAGGTEPLNLSLRLGLHAYQAALRGQASLPRLRELAQTAGFDQAGALEGLGGSPAALDLTMQGPWLLPVQDVSAPRRADTVTGTVALHDATWRAAFLVNPVQIANATLHMDAGAVRWDPVAFTYGPVKGTARLILPLDCPGGETSGETLKSAEPCLPQADLSFASITAEEVESALLGAPHKGTLLSGLMDRLHPQSAPSWPQISATLHAGSFALGPVAVHQASAGIKIGAQSAEISSLQGVVLGGNLYGTATLSWGDVQNQPSYSVDAHVDGAAAAAVGQLVGMRWSGGPLDVNGKVDLSGFTAADLASSATGKLHFDWKHGSITGGNGKRTAGATAEASPEGLEQFDDWSGDATIAKGALNLGHNQVVTARRTQALDGNIPLSKSARMQLTAARPDGASR